MKINFTLTTLFTFLIFFLIGRSALAYDGYSFETQNSHKLSTQGVYSEQDTLNESELFSYNLKYDGSYIASFPQEEWAEWDVLFRPWLVVNSSDEVSDSFSAGGTQFEGEYLEAREFYVRKNLLFGMPSLNLTVGRQQYTDYYGIWWDDSIESIKLNFDKTVYGGFVAFGKKFYNYNTEENKLSENEMDTYFLMAESWFLADGNTTTGIRFFGQYDDSVANDNELSDFQGVKLGYFMDIHQPLDSDETLDFVLDFSLISGTHQNINDGSSFINGEESVQGWLFITEIMKNSRLLNRSFSYGIRFGMTDSPDNPYSGSSLFAVQSDRVSRANEYSTSLSGTMLDNRLNNMRFFGVMGEIEINDRSHVEVLMFDLYKRNEDLSLNYSIGENYAEGNGSNIGQSLEVFYFWEMFPVKYEERRVTVDVLTSVGYFHGGDAISGDVDDYKFSVGLSVTF